MSATLVVHRTESHRWVTHCIAPGCPHLTDTPRRTGVPQPDGTTRWVAAEGPRPNLCVSHPVTEVKALFAPFKEGFEVVYE